jgi:hypothetical protein
MAGFSSDRHVDIQVEPCVRITLRTCEYLAKPNTTTITRSKPRATVAVVRIRIRIRVRLHTNADLRPISFTVPSA